jgi:hypothetical protein
LLEILYGLLAVWLALYGLNSLALTLIYLRVRREKPKAFPQPVSWPTVTVQLPVYNELHVVERAIAAAVALDYPRDRLQIQVLDDSTDATTALAQHAVACWAQMGLNIQHLHRSDRDGFKAGALAQGLRHASGELVAVFDADFVPPSDFLRRVIPYFAQPEVGCIQARWDHLNRTYSLLTRAQAMGIDAHFQIEQRARSRAGLFLNFNGSAGVWRRACIEDAGGWRADTLTEDLDLSYRAQLRGWRVWYVPDVSVAGELPPQFDGLRRQQARWAQGSIQVARKVLPRLLASPQPWPVKLEGALHLTGYMVHPLLLATLLLTLPMALTHGRWPAFLPYFLLASSGPPLLCLVGQVERGQRAWRHLAVAPLVLLMGMGLALNNAVAMARAFLGGGGEFQRTPKFAVRGSQERWENSAYALRCSPLVRWELLLAVFALLSAWLTAGRSVSALSVWLLIYALGYGFVAALSLGQALQARHRLVARSRFWSDGGRRMPGRGPR